MGTSCKKFKAVAFPVCVIILVSVTWACNFPIRPEQTSDVDCLTVVDGMYDLILHLGLPEHLISRDASEVIRQGDEFDVNQYFNVLTSLSMESGYTLDYVYEAFGGNGSPTLYTRVDGAERYLTFSEFQQALDGTAGAEAQAVLQQDFLAHVIPEDTEDGYFQMAVLHLLGEQFYLQWHANYDDDIIVCSQEHLKKGLEEYTAWIVESDPDEIEEILKGVEDESLAPQVILNDDTAEVSLVFFTKWGGVYLATYEFSRQGLHAILDISLENLYEYDCGIMF